MSKTTTINQSHSIRRLAIGAVLAVTVAGSGLFGATAAYADGPRGGQPGAITITGGRTENVWGDPQINQRVIADVKLTDGEYFSSTGAGPAGFADAPGGLLLNLRQPGAAGVIQDGKLTDAEYFRN